MTDATNVDEYLGRYPEPMRSRLGELRKCILGAVPGLNEKISYGMPAYALGKILVYFGASKKHLGFYPTASGIAAFQAEFDSLGLKWSKGAVQFPHDKPLPLDLVKRITQFRAAEVK